MYSVIRTSELEKLKSIQIDFLNQLQACVKQEQAKASALEATYKEEISLLKKEIESLKDKLNINSSNSGIPTSKEVYQKEKKNRKKSNRNPGGQPGHKVNKYKFKEADRVHEVDTKEQICTCGGCLELTSHSVHQKIEIPVVKPEIDEYRLAQKRCTKCGKKYKAKLDNYKVLGPNSESIIGALGGFFNNSKRDIQQILSQIFNLDISLGLISETEKRVSSKLEKSYKELLEEVEESSYLHIDETGHKNQGKRFWCWFLGNSKISLFHLAKTRGKKVLAKLLPEYDGLVVSDRYASYNYFERENRQICLAHLRRDFKRFAHSSNADIAAIGKELLNKLDRVFAVYNAYKSKKIPKLYYLRKIRVVEKKMYSLLKKLRHESKLVQVRRIANNILKSFDMMWLFVDHEHIEPTNNFAERQIKHHVKYRKNSYHTWSDRGDRFIERIKSIYATAKLQQNNPFAILSGLIRNA